MKILQSTVIATTTTDYNITLYGVYSVSPRMYGLPTGHRTLSLNWQSMEYGFTVGVLVGGQCSWPYILTLAYRLQPSRKPAPLEN